MLSGIAPNKRLAIAFSGGLDSRFLSFAAKYLGYTVKLLTVRGPHISAEETAEAVDTEALYTYRPDWDDVLNRLAESEVQQAEMQTVLEQIEAKLAELTATE